MTIAFRDSQQAFADAIYNGVLSVSRDADHYIGDYMYMFTEHGQDNFKNRNTRQYLRSPAPVLNAIPDRGNYANYDPQSSVTND